MMKKVWAPALVACLLAGVLPAPALQASPVIIRYICFDRAARLTRPDARGVVRGTRADDVIVTKARDVVVIGGGGNDRICASGRNAYVAGGGGHDLISTSRGDNLVRGGEGDDVLLGGPGNDRLVGGFGDSDTVVGGAGDDRLEGGDEGADYLFGGRGADRLLGGDGVSDDDFLVGGEGTDSIEAGGGIDTVSFAFSELGVQIDLATGVSSSDVLTDVENVDGSRFDDVLVGDEVTNRLFGDDGDDALAGAGGADYIDGGSGRDYLDGGEGSDFLAFLASPVGVTADLETGASGGESTDSLTAFEYLHGSAYDDELSGDAGSNELYGSRGMDALFGRDGDDYLDSGSSGDAGPGNDTCWDSGGTVANCEDDLHRDPPASSTVTAPTQALTIPVAQLKEFTGTASAGAFGPEPGRVQIALRRLSGSGCYWWDERRGAMIPGHCERPVWVATDFDDGQGTWSRRVPAPVRLLNPGRYQLRSRIHQPGYTEQGASPGYNLVEFRLQ